MRTNQAAVNFAPNQVLAIGESLIKEKRGTNQANQNSLTTGAHLNHKMNQRKSIVKTDYIKNCTHNRKEEFDICSIMTNISVKGAKHLGTYLTGSEEEELTKFVKTMLTLNISIEKGIYQFRITEGDERCDILEKIFVMCIKHPIMRWGINHERVEMGPFLKLVSKFAAGKHLLGTELGETFEDITEFLEWGRNLLKNGTPMQIDK